MMTSLDRSLSVRYPSESKLPTSPVCSHPLRKVAAESCVPARVIAVRDVLFRQRSDRHRALALPVDLNKPRAETVERAQRILDIHGRAAPDDGANVLRVAVTRRIDQPLDHGRRREHGGARPTAEQSKNLGRLKAAGFRNDVDAEPRHMRHNIEARAVAHR